MIVDDFDNFIFSVRQMLKGLGVTEIDSARNGVDAVELCVRNHYDVILCDYNLGADKNGQQVLEELKHRKLLKNNDMFVIISAEAAKDMVYSALEFQPDGYITKPVTQSLLQNRLDKLITQKEATKGINKAIDQQDYAKAITHCNQHLLKKTPYRGWVLRTLANLYYISGDYQSASKIYGDVVLSRPLDWARLGIGKIQFMEGKYQEAIATFEALVAEKPELMEAYDWQAKAEQKLGKSQKAQETLQAAISISPRALSRQLQLAETSQTNYDLDCASKAYRSAAKLSENSCLESPEIYLDYTRCLSDLAEGDNSKLGRKLADEAVKALDKLRRKYKDKDSVQILSHMIEARVFAGQEKAKDSNKALQKAVQQYSELGDSEPWIALELAETYYATDHPENASALLTDLAGKHPADGALLQKIDELRDEPVTVKQRIKARELNRQGIQKYELNALPEALEIFEQAMDITPQNVGLNLNLLQTVVKCNDAQLIKQDSMSKILEVCFKRLSHLPANHRQYKRYQHLLGRYHKLYAIQ